VSVAPVIPTDVWAQPFDSWVAGCVESGHVEELTRYRALAPFSELAIPTDLSRPSQDGAYETPRCGVLEVATSMGAALRG